MSTRSRAQHSASISFHFAFHLAFLPGTFHDTRRPLSILYFTCLCRSSWNNWARITTRWPKTDLPFHSKSTRTAEVTCPIIDSPVFCLPQFRLFFISIICLDLSLFSFFSLAFVIRQSMRPSSVRLSGRPTEQCLLSAELIPCRSVR